MSCSGGRPPEATCQSRRFPSPYPLLLPATREFHPPTHPGAPKIFSFWPRQLNITFEHSFLFLRDPALPFRVTCQFALEPFAAPLTRDDVCARRLFSGTCENATTSLLPALDSSRSPASPPPNSCLYLQACLGRGWLFTAFCATGAAGRWSWWSWSVLVRSGSFAEEQPSSNTKPRA